MIRSWFCTFSLQVAKKIGKFPAIGAALQMKELPAQLRLPFDEIDAKALAGRLESRGHAGHPAADHEQPGSRR